MKINRRVFFTTATAACTAIQQKVFGKILPQAPIRQCGKFWLSYRCFNCHHMTSPSTWLPGGVLILDKDWLLDPANDSGCWSISSHSDGYCRARVHVCDSCLDAIRHCATCGRPLGVTERGLMLESGAGLRLSSACDWVHPVTGLDKVYRDLIVADCPSCAIC